MMQNAFERDCRSWLNDAHPTLAKQLSPVDTDTQQRLSLAYPPSTCPHCHQTIKPWHNIPVVSYLLLRGRCAYCGTSINCRYPLIEGLTAGLTVMTVFLLGFSGSTLFALLLLWALIALSMIDLDTYLLPDCITLPLLWLGLFANSWGWYTDLYSAVAGALAGYLSLWLVFQVFHADHR